MESSHRVFDIDEVMDAVREAVRPYPPAALFALYDAGFRSPFEQLVACLLSIRTRDETMLPTALRLFAAARTPAELAALEYDKLDALISGCAFHAAKAHQILAISKRVADEFRGKLPCDREIVLSFVGVGPKCANLALGIGCGTERIGVDIHVHRVTNRWGYVAAATPELTMAALERRLPRKYWLEINRLLVPFGKHICTGLHPKCSTCPVQQVCAKVGVKDPR